MEHCNTQSGFSGVQVDISINVEETDIVSIEVEDDIFGEKVGIFSRIFGCRHPRMSKPVTTKNITYKYCPHCGIRRRYDIETFKPHGSFYYPSKNKNLYHV